MKTSRYSSIEPLEPRIAPASITINAATKTATWTDHDGDLVTVKWTTATAPIFNKVDTGEGLLVGRIDLTPGDHQNIGLAITVKAVGRGDGYVDLGRLSAAGVVIKSLTGTKASFGEIDAGDGTKSIAALSLYSLGSLPVSNFPSHGGDGTSSLPGVFTSFKLTGDIGSGRLTIGKSDAASGSFTVGGSIRGDSPNTFAPANGYINVSATKLAAFYLGGNLVGGDSANDGRVTLDAVVAKLTIKGSIIGGEATGTGYLDGRETGTFLLGGSVLGGTANSSGAVSLTSANSLTITGSIIGGSALESNGFVSFSKLGSGTIGGSVQGGTSILSGYFSANEAKSLTINGSILSGSVRDTGYVSLGTVSSFTLKGGIHGHTGTEMNASGGASGYAQLGNAATVNILGGIHAGRTLTGLDPYYNGALFLEGNAGSVTIKGGIHGNEETLAYVLASGTPVGTGSFDAIKKLSITGDVAYAIIATGHSKTSAGGPLGLAENSDAGLGSVTVTGNWQNSSVMVGINDSGTLGVSANDTRDTGEPTRQAKLGLVKITGRVLHDPAGPNPGGFEAENIAKITVGGATVFQSGDPEAYLDLLNTILVREL